jgi:hypothetical protein
MCESKRWTQQFYNNNVAFIATGTIVSSLLKPALRCFRPDDSGLCGEWVETPFYEWLIKMNTVNDDERCRIDSCHDQGDR